MKIHNVKSLAIPEIKVVKFSRFLDDRGYFSEQFRKSDFKAHIELKKIGDFVQANESYSKKDTIRGLHFQWNPYMGKLVRVLSGKMIEMVLDIRKGSPTYGKMLLYQMSSSENEEYSEWLWVPPGFAQGFFFLEPTTLEYLCTGEYNSQCEAGISPFAKDIDWSLCPKELKQKFDDIASKTSLVTEKDRKGFSLTNWERDERSTNFDYQKLK